MGGVRNTGVSQMQSVIVPALKPRLPSKEVTVSELGGVPNWEAARREVKIQLIRSSSLYDLFGILPPLSSGERHFSVWTLRGLEGIERWKYVEDKFCGPETLYGPGRLRLVQYFNFSVPGSAGTLLLVEIPERR